MKRIKYVGPGDFYEIPEVGETVSGTSFYETGYREIHPTIYPYYADAAYITDSTLVSGIDMEYLVINDGELDVAVSGVGNQYDGVGTEKHGFARDYMKYPDEAFNVRFRSSPERLNGFESKDVQRAIEESKQSAFGNDSDTLQFAKQGSSSNNTYLLTLNNISGNDSPDHVPWDVLFLRWSVATAAAPPAPFTLALWKINPDHSVASIVYTETFSITNGNFTGHSGYTLSNQNIVIEKGYGIYVQVTAVGNPKPTDLNVLCWTRRL